MKQLQKDTTTPEQSQRLLELGVPKWTANYKHPLVPCSDGSMVLDMDNVVSCKELYDGEIPLWSVGRLMEIIDICALGENSDPNIEEYPSTIKVMNKLHIMYIEYLVKSMERAMQLGTIDFSKLED